MLKTQVITNTWNCDQCGAEIVSELCPFYKLSVQPAVLLHTAPCELDICPTCIQLVALQSVTDYLAGLPPTP